jgi:hypothetical protein
MGFLNKIFGGSKAGNTDYDFFYNELEKLLDDFLNGKKGSIDPVLKSLVKSQVSMLFLGEPESSMSGKMAEPLVLDSARGFPGICIFTSRDRANEMFKLHPDYKTGIDIEFTWVLDNCAPGAGIIINPGTNLSIELPPDKVPVFREEVHNGDYD